jgi:glutaminase
MLAQLASCCAARGQQLVLSRVRRSDLLTGLADALSPQGIRAVHYQPHLDAALELCERGLLARHAAHAPVGAEVLLEKHRLCAGLTPEDLAQLQSRLLRREHDPGMLIVQRGDPADAVYLVAQGEVSVIVDLPQGGHKRLSTLSAGMSFGETALTVGGVRSADVRADGNVVCWVLTAEVFKLIRVERPSLAAALLYNLLTVASDTIRRLTNEVAALEA